jgi:succinate-semialdehyde dehydrogenase / glutarate-semialdehyde dehydrogenase
MAATSPAMTSQVRSALISPRLPSGADLAYWSGEPRSAEFCQEVDMYTQLGLYIDGEWLNGDKRAGEDVINPANEKVLARLPHATTSDLDRALAAAVKGFGVWRDKSAYERGRIMKKAADLLRERAEHVARVLTQEQGKILAEARMEVLTTADIIEWYAEEGKRAYGRIVPGRVKGTRQLVIQEPVGVVTAFTPWNFPTLTPARKIGGALAAGCSLN